MFCCRELRSSALVGLQGELCITRRERPPVIPTCSSTSEMDACTETHVDRLYARTGKKIIATKVPSRAGVAQAQTPGAGAIISPLGPAPVVQ